MAEPWTDADAEFFRHWLSECIKRSSHAGTAAFLRRAAAEIERLALRNRELEAERDRLREDVEASQVSVVALETVWYCENDACSNCAITPKGDHPGPCSKCGSAMYEEDDCDV